MEIHQNPSFSSVLTSRIIIISMIFLFFCGKSPIASAQDTIEINSDKQIDYANHFYEKQDYQAAAAEYKKFIYFFPKDERTAFADYRIGMSLFLDKAYIPALNHFADIFDQKGPSDTGLLSAFMISRCYQRVRNYSAAIENLVYLNQLTDDGVTTDNISYQLGWIYLESGEIHRARASFSNITLTGREKFDTNKLNSDLDNYAGIPQKNPATAGFLSIIPGGGYLYCGRYRDALTAFLVNSVLIYGAYECFDKELYAIGGIITALEVGFYSGNIYGGVSSAHKYNRRKQNEFVQKLKTKYDPDMQLNVNMNFSMKIKHDDFLMGMALRF